MRIVRTVGALRAALDAPRRAGKRIGFVPTMGAFHEGHVSLMRRARGECDVVVVSLFVNPTQFNDDRDLERYPRDEAADAAMATAAGVDLLFAPEVTEIYPPGFATTVEVRGVSEPLEGEARGPVHFRGVATVVAKLLNIVQPTVAYFGQKDAQQLLVVRRMVRDLDIPVEIVAVPTLREPDGVAMSSRNALLDAAARPRAVALYGAIVAAERAAAAGERRAEHLLDAAHAAMDSAGVEPEYLALVDPETLAPVAALGDTALLAIAARVGGVRLIDNALLRASRP